ncbi:MAG: HlyC/CorC family transporter [Alphaproteobacteria bacterium]|nr:HlyC/CorC family transporter [Alphaproteobacteria bacterium]
MPEIMKILLIIFLLLLLSAFFSGSETALTAASRGRMLQLKKQGNQSAKVISRLMQNRNRLIISLLLGNNLVNILASALLTSVLINLFGETGVLYTTLIMTLILILAEVIPKTYAANKPDQVSLQIAWIISPFVTILSPLTKAIQYFTQFFLRLLGTSESEKQTLLSAHDDLRGAIDLHHSEGSVIKVARDMLGGILNLKDLDVSDIMVHRTNMLTVNADDQSEKIVSTVLSSTYTRIPLWQKQSENIIGILHAKDLARALMETEGSLPKLNLLALAKTPWFVPDSTPLQDQLNAFLKRKAHFALVVDEYGEVMGLVTLEDILEEIVGDIIDEHDTIITGVQIQPDGSIIVEGSVPIRDLNRATEWNLPEEQATTIAGLVIHEARMIPEQAQIFTFHNFRFQILRRQHNRITLLKITPLDKET